MIRVELVGVRVDSPSSAPMVRLRELGEGGRSLSIYIAQPEATAIALALEGVETPRPLTHDLFCNVLDELGASLDEVVVTEIRGTTYYAELHLDVDGEELSVSSRPSDAIALAVRAGCPIYVDDEVLEVGGFVEHDDEASEAPPAPVADPDEVVEEFRQFIDRISPDDFDPGS